MTADPSAVLLDANLLLWAHHRGFSHARGAGGVGGPRVHSVESTRVGRGRLERDWVSMTRARACPLTVFTETEPATEDATVPLEPPRGLSARDSRERGVLCREDGTVRPNAGPVG